MIYIVLVNWHGWRDTLECLRSLQKLEGQCFQTVVVDNGSTDDSVQRIRQAFPDVVLLETGENRGFSGGNNVGIRYAMERGAEYIWLLNNDTAVHPQALAAMVKVAEENPRVGVVGSVLYYMECPDRVQAWGGGIVNFVLGTAEHHHGPVPQRMLHYLTGASMLLRRRALEEVGLLDDTLFFMYWEDTDLCFRMRKAGWDLRVAADATIWHKESVSLPKVSLRRDMLTNCSAVRFFRRHAPVPVIPIAIGVSGRIFKRVLKGRFSGATATLRGMVIGYRGVRMQ